MKRYRFAAWCALVAMFVNTGGIYAQTEFKKAFQEHYGLKSVSCNTCHVSGKPKQMRNDLGKLFEKELAGKNVSQRLKDAREADNSDEIKAEVVNEFLQALERIEKTAYPDGGTFADAVKAGKIDGAKVE